MLTAEKIEKPAKKKSAMKKKVVQIGEATTPTKTGDLLRHSRLLENLMMSPSALSARKFEMQSERKHYGAQEDLVRCK
jgi:hypothetical protein